MAVTGESLALGLAVMGGYAYWKFGVIERKIDEMSESLESLKEVVGHTMGEVRNLHHELIDTPELKRIMAGKQ